MVEAKALFKAHLKEFNELSGDASNEVIREMIGLYKTCIIAATITNSRDAICQSIDALTAAIKESGA